MNQERFATLTILSIAYALCSPTFGGVQNYHSEHFGYTISLPENWVRVPKNVFDERLARIATVQGESKFITEVAFQDKEVPWFEGDYLLVMIFLTGSQLSDENIRQAVKGITQVEPERLGSNMSLFGADVDVKPGTVKFDPIKRSYLWQLDSKIDGERWIMTTYGFFGRSSLVHVAFYSKPSQEFAKTEKLVASSFKFDPPFVYADPTSSSSSNLTSKSPEVTKLGVGEALGSQGTPLSSTDVDAISKFMNLPDRWNRAAAPLVRDYLDPNVPANRWVKEASAHIAELRAAHVEMTVLITAIENRGVRETFKEIAANYRTKLDSVTALHIAVAQGNVKAELEAKQMLIEATSEGQKLGEALLDKIRPFVDPKILQEEAQRRGSEIGELMKPK